MRCALIVFEQMTMLDLVGFYDPVTRLKSMKFVDDLSIEVCGTDPTVRDDRGLTLQTTAIMPDLSHFDLVFLPGGWGTRKLKDDADFIAWNHTAYPVPWKVSACTGALLLGAAGLLKDVAATTHPKALDLLRPYCREVKRDRLVRENGIITAGGVTAAIDLGLYMCEVLAGSVAAQAIAVQMDYPYFDPVRVG